MFAARFVTDSRANCWRSLERMAAARERMLHPER
jgi:hypothetical protein